MSQQLVRTAWIEPTGRSSERNNAWSLFTAVHATVCGTARSIAHNGPPLDMMTQLCSAVAHVDLDIAEYVAREGLRAVFRAGQIRSSVLLPIA